MGNLARSRPSGRLDQLESWSAGPIKPSDNLPGIDHVLDQGIYWSIAPRAAQNTPCSQMRMESFASPYATLEKAVEIYIEARNSQEMRR